MKSLRLDIGPIGGATRLSSLVRFVQPNQRRTIQCEASPHEKSSNSKTSKIPLSNNRRVPLRQSNAATYIESELNESSNSKVLVDPPTTSRVASRDVEDSLIEEQLTKPGLSQRLQGWLPWTSSIPFASQLNTSSSVDDPFLELGDGMAMPNPSFETDQTTSAPRRGWYIMRRRRQPTSSSTSSSSMAESSVLDARPVQVDHPTLQLLKQRILSNSKPGNRKDGFKLGLAIEGGGMRGCVSGGALQALSDLGLRDVFDAVYGSSAGAINATFFLANQRDGVHIYHNHIASEEFIDLKRLWSRKPGTPAALNLDLLLGPVIEDLHPLNFDAVLSSEIPLNVVASSLASLSPVLLQNFTDKDDLVTCLRASATVPEVAGGPVHHRGHAMVDAAVFEPVPFRSAIADGCTHVLVLCTRPPPPTRKGYLNQALTYAMETVVKKAVLSPEYMVPAWHAEVQAMMKDGIHHDDMLVKSFDDDAHELPWFAGSHVYPVYPKAGASSFSPLCIDVPTLKQGVAEGRRSVLSIIDALLMSEPSMASVLDLSQFQETANILPLPRRSAAGRRASERLWKKYMNEYDFSSHHSNSMNSSSMNSSMNGDGVMMEESDDSSTSTTTISTTTTTTTSL